MLFGGLDQFVLRLKRLISNRKRDEKEIANIMVATSFRFMPLSAELHEYAVDLAFKGGDPSKRLALFEQFSDDCVDQYDYIVMLQILAYAKGRADPSRVYDFWKSA